MRLSEVSFRGCEARREERRGAVWCGVLFIRILIPSLVHIVDDWESVSVRSETSLVSIRTVFLVLVALV